MTGRLGIALGDVTGIGPEVALKAVAAELPLDETRYLLIGDESQLRALNESLRLNLPFSSAPPCEVDRLQFCQPQAALPAGLPPGAPAAADAAMAWLHEGARRCLSGEITGLVTAPVNKESIINAGHQFVGQTELLSELAGARDTAMMLLGTDDRGRWLRVVLATTHVALRLVADNLSQEKIERVIALAAAACRDLGLPRARIAVCGLNPHAGEGGHMGTEEQTTIAPAIAAAKGRGLDATGPHSADALFYHVLRGAYDAVVAMYHDQGLVPLKMIGFETGVNWTLGLPFIRTSPDHGTAYDIAGKGLASASSMIAAIRLAKQLARRKKS